MRRHHLMSLCALIVSSVFCYGTASANPLDRAGQPGAAQRLATLKARVAPVKSFNPVGPAKGLAGSIYSRLKHGHGESVYWPNGRLITCDAGRIGGNWYHANGRLLTSNALAKGSTCYYENGQVMTYDVGVRGATWYYENGAVMTHDAGIAGARWYDNRGNVTTWSGPSYSEKECMDRCYVRLIEDSLSHQH